MCTTYGHTTTYDTTECELVPCVRPVKRYENCGLIGEMPDDLPGVTIHFPAEWGRNTTGEIKAQLGEIAQILKRGAEAMCGLYLRMCRMIRDGPLTDSEVRETLAPHFPHSRISEILRVSHAPREVYLRYTAGFFGFKAALRECRGYTVTPSSELRRRRARRAAERLIALLGDDVEITVRDRVVRVERKSDKLSSVAPDNPKPTVEYHSFSFW